MMQWRFKAGRTLKLNALGPPVNHKALRFVKSSVAHKVGLKQTICWQQVMETLNSEKHDQAYIVNFSCSAQIFMQYTFQKDL